MGQPTYADIEKEFDESLGYIQGDIAEIRRVNKSLNYTVALLIGCGCEVLAAGRGDRKHAEAVLAEMLDGDWKLLAGPIFNALRNGLAHSFDTKHLHVDGDEIQIYLAWGQTVMFDPRPNGLYIGTQVLAQRLHEKIDEFRKTLQNDNAACQVFRQASDYQSAAKFSQIETDAWKRLTKKP